MLRSPIHKLKLISRTVDDIKKCISNFYYRNDIVTEWKLSMGDLKEIFIYILSRCKINSLIAECQFIKIFCSEDTLKSNAGELLNILIKAYEYYS